MRQNFDDKTPPPKASFGWRTEHADNYVFIHLVTTDATKPKCARLLQSFLAKRQGAI
jgi:hypothetical protein